MKAFYEPSL